MKRILKSLLLSSLFFTGICFADGKNSRLLMDTSKLINPKADHSDEYLATNIKNSISNDIQNYSDIMVISSDDKGLIRKLQIESQDLEYDEESNVVEIGKLLNAALVVQIEISRNLDKDTYSATSNIIDINTGARIGGTTTPYYNQSVFLNRAHGEIAFGIMTSLGKTFSPAEERLIKNGNSISADANSIETKEDLFKINEELEKVRLEMAKIDITTLTDTQAIAEKNRKEQYEEILIQKQKLASEKLKRIEEAENRAKQEEENRANLNAQQNRQIKATTEKIYAQIKLQQEKLLDAMTGIQKVVVIENEKQTLAQMYAEIERNINDYNILMDQDAAEEMDTVEDKYVPTDELYSAFFNENGRLTPEGIELIKIEKREVQEKYNILKVQNQKELVERSKLPIANLREKITSDIETLDKNETFASSATDEDVYFNVEDFNTGLNGWKYNLIFSLSGVEVFRYTGTISYKELTGKNPAKPSDGSQIYKDYISDAKMYDSYFRLGTKYVTADITYKLKTSNYDKASQYLIQFISVYLVNQENGKKIKKIPITSSIATFQYSPVTQVDWRSDLLKDADAKKALEEARLLKEEAERKQRMEEKLAAEKAEMERKAAIEAEKEVARLAEEQRKIKLEQEALLRKQEAEKAAAEKKAELEAEKQAIADAKRAKKLQEEADKLNNELEKARIAHEKESLKLQSKKEKYLLKEWNKKEKDNKKEAKKRAWNRKQRKKSSLRFLYVVPLDFTYIQTNENNYFFDGFGITFPIKQHGFLGLDAGAGLPVNEFNSFEEKELSDFKYFVNGQLGVNWNWARWFRNSLFIEAGYIEEKLGTGCGAEIELMGEKISLYASGSYGFFPDFKNITGTDQLNNNYLKINVGLEIAF